MSSRDPTGARQQSERQRLRARIDQLDQRIMRLLNQRARLALAIGRSKKQTRSAIVEPNREAQVLANVARLSQAPLNEAMSAKIFRAIMLVMRELQRT